MESKMFEIRDAGTFLVVLCTAMVSDALKERYLLRRTGYGGERRFIMLTWLTTNESHYHYSHWGGRTMPVAHEYIEDHWDELESGDVVDVQFILGETDSVKVSERLVGGVL